MQPARQTDGISFQPGAEPKNTRPALQRTANISKHKDTALPSLKLPCCVYSVFRPKNDAYRPGNATCGRIKAAFVPEPSKEGGYELAYPPCPLINQAYIHRIAVRLHPLFRVFLIPGAIPGLLVSACRRSQSSLAASRPGSAHPKKNLSFTKQAASSNKHRYAAGAWRFSGRPRPEHRRFCPCRSPGWPMPEPPARCRYCARSPPRWG